MYSIYITTNKQAPLCWDTVVSIYWLISRVLLHLHITTGRTHYKFILWRLSSLISRVLLRCYTFTSNTPSYSYKLFTRYLRQVFGVKGYHEAIFGQEKPERLTHTVPSSQFSQTRRPISSHSSVMSLDSVRGSKGNAKHKDWRQSAGAEVPSEALAVQWSASEVALRRKEENSCCLWSTMQGLSMCLHRGN